MFSQVLLVVIGLLLAPLQDANPAQGQAEKNQDIQAEKPEMPTALSSVLDPASDIPPELLALDYKACFDGCRAGNFGAPVCTALCSCSIRQLQKRYVMKSYVTMKAQSVRNAFDEGNKIIMVSIGETCAADVTAKGLLIQPETDQQKPGEGEQPLPKTEGDGSQKP